MCSLSQRCIYKFIITALILITMVSVPEVKAAVVMQQPLLKAIEKCRQETGATKADFEAFLTKKNPSSMTAKCMRACLMKQFYLMDENGKFNRDIALRIAEEFVGTNAEKMRIATEIVDACYTMAVSENHCEAAEQYGKCANEQGRESRARREKRSPIDDLDEFADTFF